MRTSASSCYILNRESYSRRENLKFIGIAGHHNSPRNNRNAGENTKDVLFKSSGELKISGVILIRGIEISCLLPQWVAEGQNDLCDNRIIHECLKFKVRAPMQFSKRRPGEESTQKFI